MEEARGASMTQLSLVTVPEPDQPPGVEIRCCTCRDLLDSLPRPPALIIADPPWSYSQAPGHSANPENHYDSMSDIQIAELLDRAWDTMEKGRLAMWCTWPKLDEWNKAKTSTRWRWRYVSGGSWHKFGGQGGTGYHWLGASELVELSVKGSGLCTEWGSLQNAHTSERRKHSEKPVEWMEDWIKRWTKEDDLVVDLFAGLGPAARAAARTGRDYLGAEIDPQRYRQAVDRLALDRANWKR